MNNTLKQKLAHWMGWETKWPKGGLVIFIMHRDGETILKSFSADKWNPHENHDQFLKVLEHIPVNERGEIVAYLLDTEFAFPSMKDDITITTWYMSHKKETINALCKVLTYL